MYTCNQFKKNKIIHVYCINFILSKESYIQFISYTQRKITLNMWAYKVFFAKCNYVDNFVSPYTGLYSLHYYSLSYLSSLTLVVFGLYEKVRHITKSSVT